MQRASQRASEPRNQTQSLMLIIIWFTHVTRLELSKPRLRDTQRRPKSATISFFGPNVQFGRFDIRFGSAIAICRSGVHWARSRHQWDALEWCHSSQLSVEANSGRGRVGRLNGRLEFRYWFRVVGRLGRPTKGDTETEIDTEIEIETASQANSRSAPKLGFRLLECSAGGAGLVAKQARVRSSLLDGTSQFIIIELRY